MPRRSRLVIPGLPHHITQRGCRRQDIFFTDLDRDVYLGLLNENGAKYGVDLLTFTLMTNHVHHLMVPQKKDSLQWTLQMTHKRYAEYINAREGWTGHLWQSRFYSSPVDNDYFWVTVRYILQNPVKAGMVRHARDYRWSNAGYLCRGEINPHVTSDEKWSSLLSTQRNWTEWLSTEEDPQKIAELKRSTLRDLPTGSDQFLDRLERDFGVQARAPKIGRPKVGKA
jgi:putative transposase